MRTDHLCGRIVGSRLLMRRICSIATLSTCSLLAWLCSETITFAQGNVIDPAPEHAAWNIAIAASATYTTVRATRPPPLFVVIPGGHMGIGIAKFSTTDTRLVVPTARVRIGPIVLSETTDAPTPAKDTSVFTVQVLARSGA